MTAHTPAQQTEITSRRFGPAHEQKCNDPAMIECSRPVCQVANKCQIKKRVGRAMRKALAELKEAAKTLEASNPPFQELLDRTHPR